MVLAATIADESPANVNPIASGNSIGDDSSPAFSAVGTPLPRNASCFLSTDTSFVESPASPCTKPTTTTLVESTAATLEEIKLAETTTTAATDDDANNGSFFLRVCEIDDKQPNPTRPIVCLAVPLSEANTTRRAVAQWITRSYVGVYSVVDTNNPYGMCFGPGDLALRLINHVYVSLVQNRDHQVYGFLADNDPLCNPLMTGAVLCSECPPFPHDYVDVYLKREPWADTDDSRPSHALSICMPCTNRDANINYTSGPLPNSRLYSQDTFCSRYNPENSVTTHHNNSFSSTNCKRLKTSVA